LEEYAVHVVTSQPVRRAVATAVVVIATAALSGCGSSFNAQTDQIYQPAVGANNRESQVYVLNALLVTGGGTNGALVAGLLNEAGTDDVLTGVTAKASNGNDLTSTIVGDQVPLPSRSLVRLSQDAAVAISGTDAAELGAGGSISVTFTFQNADPVTLDAPIEAREGPYADVPLPTPSASSTPAPSTPTQSP
jgi:copper(I)-binding protein